MSKDTPPKGDPIAVQRVGSIEIQQYQIGPDPLVLYRYSDTQQSADLNDTARSILVMSHGLSNAIALEDKLSLPDWRPLAKQFDLIRYDAIGHGLSGGSVDSERYHWARQTADMAAVLDWVDQAYPVSDQAVRDIVLVGCSMSSAVALHLFVQRNAGDWSDRSWFSRVKALVMTLPPAGWAARAEIRSHYIQKSELLRKGGIKAYQRAVAQQQPIGYIADARPENRQISAEYIDHQHPDWLAAQFFGAAESDYPSGEALSQISLPILLLARSEDAFHPDAFAQHLTTIFPVSACAVAKSCTDIESWPARVSQLARMVGEIDLVALDLVANGLVATEMTPMGKSDHSG
jgi:pimeloyl-ACP methyl ester carboxylesterase